jgi:hypothetical protein
MATTHRSDRGERIKRIKSRGCPEVIQALEGGKLGLKTLDRLSRLPLKEQRVKLVQLLEAREANTQCQAAWRADPRRGAAVYASQSYEKARARRLRRIERRATAELKEAYSEGRLSLRAYDELSKLSPKSQQKTIKSDRHKEQAQNLAAAAIRAVLAHKPQRIDLGLIAAKVITAIRGAPIRS